MTEDGQQCENARCSLHSIDSLGFGGVARPWRWSRVYSTGGGLRLLVWAIGRIGLTGATSFGQLPSA